MNKNIYCYKDDWDEIINQIKIISFTKNSAKIIGNTPEKKAQYYSIMRSRVSTRL